MQSITRLLFSVALLLAAIVVSAQTQSPPPIQLIGQPKGDRIWLRWAPVSSTFWTLGNKHGYVVERFALTNSGDLENETATRLTPNPLKPVSAAEFERLSATVPEASVLQELLYAKPTSTNSKNRLARSADAENEFGIALLVCDLSQPVAKAAGLFLEDATAKRGVSYIYRVSIAFTPKSGALAPAVAVVSFTDEVKLAANREFKVQFGDRKATLSWPTLFDRGVYTAYYIEKSTDNGEFKRVSDLPYVHMTRGIDDGSAFYVDSLANNTSTFGYRIQGLTPFGELGPYTDAVSGKGSDDLSGFLVLNNAELTGQAVKVQWEFPQAAEKQIAGFHVLQSPTGSGPYSIASENIIPSQQRTSDVRVVGNNSYFVVRAVDAQGKEITRSFPYLVHVEDETPPATPAGVKGSVSSTGLVSLQWQANNDADVLGYRVFRSNQMADEFVEITKDILTTPVFLDSLESRTLDRDIYYRVIAVDKRYNTSVYSEALKLSRPDLIPPIAPIFVKAEQRRDTIFLSWINSASTDVASNVLRRYSKQDTAARSLTTWTNPPVDKWIDTGLTLGQTYYYELQAVDSTGNGSSARSGEIFFETGIRPAVTALKAKADRDKKQIVVQWKNPSASVHCIVFRSTNDGVFSIYKTLEGHTEQIVDTTISVGNTYNYKIQLVYKGGVRSALTNPVAVKY